LQAKHFLDTLEPKASKDLWQLHISNLTNSKEDPAIFSTRVPPSVKTIDQIIEEVNWRSKI